MEKYIFWQSPETREQVVRALNDNKVLITSTDTILGFLAKPSTKLAKQISEIKQRDSSKPFLLLVSSPDQIRESVVQSNITQSVRRLLSHVWPGPVTFIFKAHKNVPEHLVSPQATIALRCPGHDGLRYVLEHIPMLLSTSVNISKQTHAATFEDIPTNISSRVTLLVDDQPGAGPLTMGLASTIIDLSSIKCKHQLHEQNVPHECDESGRPRIVRVGAYPLAQLESYYGSAFEQ